MAKERRYCKNTVKGSRKGQKWPEQTRTAALCDLLVGNNICAVARRYGVPESTLRSWMAAARKTGREGEQSLFDAARAEQLRALNHQAAAGARASLNYVVRRLDLDARKTEVYAEALQKLNAADGVQDNPEDEPGGERIGQARGGIPPDERERLEGIIARNRPMGDVAAASYLRVLAGTLERSADMLGENEKEEAASAITFVLAGDLESLGE